MLSQAYIPTHSKQPIPPYSCPTYVFPKHFSSIYAALSRNLSLPSFYPIFPLLLVIIKPLILSYYYYNRIHNVLDTMKVFSYVNLIIIRKIYDFYHVNIFINLSDVYHWRSVILTAGPFFLLCTCYNGPIFILTNYGRNA